MKHVLLLTQAGDVILYNGSRSISADDGTYYSLNGQRVEHPTKGVFIRNGKKEIIL